MYKYKYPRPMLCVDVVLFEKVSQVLPRVLLIKRNNDPFRDCWALPGGFVEMDEDLDVAAKRELFEEAAVEISDLIQVGAFGHPKRDPRGRNISVAFTAISSREIICSPGDDAKEAGVFGLNNLPLLAFDHGLIIKSAVNTLELAKLWE